MLFDAIMKVIHFSWEKIRFSWELLFAKELAE
jgi:hypothetical protein